MFNRRMDSAWLLGVLAVAACGGEVAPDGVPQNVAVDAGSPAGDAASGSGAAASVGDAGPADAAPPVTVGPRERRITLVAVGDLLFGRYLDRDTYRRVPQPPTAGAPVEPFGDVAGLIQRADLALANLESPVLVEPARFKVHDRMTFRAEPGDLALMAAAGFDAVSFANNHALNFGAAGLSETLAHVEAAGLRALGIGVGRDRAERAEVFEVGGLRVAVLARTVWLNGHAAPARGATIAYHDNRSLPRGMVRAVEAVEAELAPDVLVVFIHWGREYEPHPRGHQQRAARAMIDAGADLVIGHHPHVIQDLERYHGGVIAYSLGNFLFDNGELRQRRSAVLEVVIRAEAGAIRVETPTLHPVLIDDQRQRPEWARGEAGRRWRKALAELAPEALIAPAPAPASAPEAR
ncbi:CapA family protein [Haliangium sp.]|uniref:CapA family protein n=1 Tax=Haliangium sp. TaxID=2663208 RepID=UPI003D14FE6A